MQDTNCQQRRRRLKAITWIPDSDAASGWDGDDTRKADAKGTAEIEEGNTEANDGYPFLSKEEGDLEGSNE
jgi:hypothetical protein